MIFYDDILKCYLKVVFNFAKRSIRRKGVDFPTFLLILKPNKFISFVFVLQKSFNHLKSTTNCPINNSRQEEEDTNKTCTSSLCQRWKRTSWAVHKERRLRCWINNQVVVNRWHRAWLVPPTRPTSHWFKTTTNRIKWTGRVQHLRVPLPQLLVAAGDYSNSRLISMQPRRVFNNNNYNNPTRLINARSPTRPTRRRHRRCKILKVCATKMNLFFMLQFMIEIRIDIFCFIS